MASLPLPADTASIASTATSPQSPPSLAAAAPHASTSTSSLPPLSEATTASFPSLRDVAAAAVPSRLGFSSAAESSCARSPADDGSFPSLRATAAAAVLPPGDTVPPLRYLAAAAATTAAAAAVDTAAGPEAETSAKPCKGSPNLHDGGPACAGARARPGQCLDGGGCAEGGCCAEGGPPGGSGRPTLGRRYLTCCVRLSPEKEPERFVALVEELSASGALQRLQVLLPKLREYVLSKVRQCFYLSCQ